MSLYNEDEISKAINSIKHEEESEGEELPMLSLGKNIENVETEETPAPFVQQRNGWWIQASNSCNLCESFQV